MTANVETYANETELADAVAERIITLAWAAIGEHGRCSIGLAGGTTVRGLFELMATRPYASRLDWDRVFLFWGDERCVPPDHPDSNYGMARKTLLEHVPVPAENVERMKGELDPAEAAEQYEAVLRRHFGDEAPRFDVLLQGMGSDGHTASLFPGTEALKERTRWVVANYVPKLESWRITLTIPAINAARNVIFMVSGPGKAEPLRDVLEGPRDPERLPSQAIAPVDGALVWMVDAAAGSLLARG